MRTVLNKTGCLPCSTPTYDERSGFIVHDNVNLLWRHVGRELGRRKSVHNWLGKRVEFIYTSLLAGVIPPFKGATHYRPQQISDPQPRQNMALICEFLVENRGATEKIASGIRGSNREVMVVCRKGRDVGIDLNACLFEESSRRWRIKLVLVMHCLGFETPGRRRARDGGRNK